MRIVLDVGIQDVADPTGVERAQATLVDALLAADRDHEWHLVSSGRVPERWRRHPAVTAHEAESPAPTWFWRETALPAVVRRVGAEVFHSPVAALPLRLRCPLVATLHELPWAGDDEGLGERHASHRLRVHLAVSFARLLLVPSARTARDLLAMHPDAEGRVTVVPHAVDPCFGEDEGPDDAARLEALGVPPSVTVVLAVGRERAKKNLGVLLEAFARREGGEHELLVLAGPPGDASDALEARAARPDLAGRVLRTGFVDDAALAALGRRAAAAVFPSLFEGFGLPVLEAMASGTPVLTSEQGAVDEATGGATRVFDGHDPQALATALAEVLDDEARAAQLVRAGREHVARHRPADVARAHLQVYESLG